MDICGITQNGLRDHNCFQTSKAEKSSCAFSDILANAVDETDDDFLNAAPEQWLTERANKTAIDIVDDFLEKMGIEKDSRAPTYSLTDKQKDWLRSRHDFDAIKRDNGSLDEENLRADLVYLGAISSDEASRVWWIAIPENVSGIQWETPDLRGVGMFDALERILQQVQNRYEDPMKRDPGDQKFIESENEHIAFREKYIELMKDLLG